jgi:hypothetical protein
MGTKRSLKKRVFSNDSMTIGERKGGGRCWRRRWTARDPAYDKAALGRLILERKKNPTCQDGVECTLDAINKLSIIAATSSAS